MNDTTTILKSALNAFGTKLRNTAHNIANLSRENARPLETALQSQPGGGVSAETRSGSSEDRVDLSEEAVAMLEAEHGFKAALAMLKTDDEIKKASLDIVA